MSSSSSKNTTSSVNTNETTTINTVDNREASGDGAVFGGNITTNAGEGSQISVQATDLGAIKGGLDLALESMQGIQQATAGAVESVKSVASDSISQAYGLANEARQSETSGAINNFLKYGAIIAGLAVVGWIVTKAK